MNIFSIFVIISLIATILIILLFRFIFKASDKVIKKEVMSPLEKKIAAMEKNLDQKRKSNSTNTL